MIVREALAMVLKFLTEMVGLEGLAIGILATVVAVLWYLREAADAFVVLARWARIGSIIGFVVLVLFVAGTVFGVVEPGSIDAALDQFTH
jgi:hypothetical protein